MNAISRIIGYASIIFVLTAGGCSRSVKNDVQLGFDAQVQVSLDTPSIMMGTTEPTYPVYEVVANIINKGRKTIIFDGVEAIYKRGEYETEKKRMWLEEAEEGPKVVRQDGKYRFRLAPGQMIGVTMGASNSEMMTMAAQGGDFVFIINLFKNGTVYGSRYRAILPRLDELMKTRTARIEFFRSA